MKSIEAVLSDLDGTLVGPDLSISAASRGALHDLREASIQLVPVTGRDFNDILPVLKGAEISGPGVFSGGSTIVDIESGEHYLNESIELELTRELIEEARKFASVIGFGLGRMAVAAVTTDMVANAPRSMWIEFQADREDAALELRQRFPDLTFHASISIYHDLGSTGLHVTPKEVDKKSATLQCLEILEIPAEHTLAIGDSLNDIPLFEVSPVSIAMGDAPQELKQIATYSTSSFSEEGFANAINKYIFE